MSRSGTLHDLAIAEVIKSFGLQTPTAPAGPDTPQPPVPYDDPRWDYDEDADVLYFHFGPPMAATQVIERDEEGLILRYRDGWLIGVTMLGPIEPRAFQTIPVYLPVTH